MISSPHHGLRLTGLPYFWRPGARPRLIDPRGLRAGRRGARGDDPRRPGTSADRFVSVRPAAGWGKEGEREGEERRFRAFLSFAAYAGQRPELVRDSMSAGDVRSAATPRHGSTMFSGALVTLYRVKHRSWDYGLLWLFIVFWRLSAMVYIGCAAAWVGARQVRAAGGYAGGPGARGIFVGS